MRSRPVARRVSRLQRKTRSIQLIRRHLASKTDVELGGPVGFNELVLIRPLVHDRIGGRLIWIATDEKKQYAIYQAKPEGAKLGEGITVSARCPGNPQRRQVVRFDVAEAA